MTVPGSPSSRQALDDHLGRAEFALKVAANFACLKGTPAHDHVHAALAQVATARAWVRGQLVAASPAVKPGQVYQSVTAQRRIIQRRMARLAP